MAEEEQNQLKHIDAKKVQVEGNGLTGGVVGEEAHFTIDVGPGLPEGFVGMLSTDSLDVIISNAENSAYQWRIKPMMKFFKFNVPVMYKVEEAGVYNIDIRLSNGEVVAGSPYTATFTEGEGLGSVGDSQPDSRSLPAIVIKSNSKFPLNGLIKWYDGTVRDGGGLGYRTLGWTTTPYGTFTATSNEYGIPDNMAYEISCHWMKEVYTMNGGMMALHHTPDYVNEEAKAQNERNGQCEYFQVTDNKIIKDEK